ncbi:MAG: HlyD family efflux transporter periplasmic adaptor subunit [Verrucomicrobia bacterium]|jgi:multidrug resistance efflux pump|nr:HlyD family efflux transporter periplasmic adaptor subunit [Verrucomicrobiota bacterium]MBT7068697.1 HlyD family efflux transporter periplasmic adaptor subunit [Verrucomicrobiota bacterium]MBT7701846.1 HlyD family efflux transporter periplasmic adaptor subunit [Verrucomicrobiota bacterium]
MKTAYQRHNLSRHPRIIVARLKQSWPLLIWALALAGAAFLYFQTGRFTKMVGAVVTVVDPIAPLQTGRLLSLDVSLGQRVKAGDTLAVMDAALLNARLSIEEARIIEADQTVSGFEQGMMRLALDADTARRDAELDLQRIQTEHEVQLASLSEMKRELERREDLLAAGLDDASRVAALRPPIAALEKEVELFPAMRQATASRVEGARGQLDALRASLEVEPDASVLKTIKERATAQREVLRASLDKRLLEKDTFVLKARRDGIVSRIFAMPGNVVGAGDVILRLVSETSNAVEGFLPEHQVASLTIGQDVSVERASGTERYPATVTAIAPEIQTLPGRVSPIRNQPVRGRRIRLAIVGEHALIPGETVWILAQ